MRPLSAEIVLNIWRETDYQRPDKQKPRKWSLGVLTSMGLHLYIAAGKVWYIVRRISQHDG